MNTLNNIIIWIGSGIVVISLIISVLMPTQRKVYMKGFFFCPFIACLISINSISSRFYFLYSMQLNFFIQIILLLCDLVFWGFFFHKLINMRRESRKIFILLVITFLISVYTIYFNKTHTPNLHLQALSNCIKVIFCISFFSKLFKEILFENILKEPSFWIVAGLMFYSAISIPFYALNNFIMQNFTIEIAYAFFSISNMLVIIMHLFFIKSFLCTIQLHKA